MIKYLDSLKIYLLILFFSVAISISVLDNLAIINHLAYLFVHILLIYLIIYYYRTFLIFIYFFLGIILDLSLLNEIGPHTITFVIILILINRIKKLLYNLNSNKIFFFIIIVLFFCIFFEKILSFLLFDYYLNINDYIRDIFYIILIAYPSIYIFNIIDNI